MLVLLATLSLFLPLTLRVLTPFPVTPQIVDAFKDFRPIRNIKVVHLKLNNVDSKYIRAEVALTFQNGTTSVPLCGYGRTLDDACTSSAAHALGEYVRLGG